MASSSIRSLLSRQLRSSAAHCRGYATDAAKVGPYNMTGESSLGPLFLGGGALPFFVCFSQFQFSG